MFKHYALNAILALTGLAFSGIAQTPELLKDIRSINNGSDIMFVANLGPLTIFSANDGVHGPEMWRTDGTEAGTFMLKDITPGTGSGISGDYFGGHVVNGMVYFCLTGAIWKTDGSVEGTQLVSSATLLPDFTPISSVVYGNTILFSARVSGTTRREVWRTDGTEAGTFVLKDIGLNVSGGSNPYYFIVLNGLAFFTATSAANGNELWKTDGTNAGTVQVKDINPGTANSIPRWLTVLGNAFYFSASDGVNGYELWKSDGTEGGTVLLKDVRSGASGSDPGPFHLVGNQLVFIADDGISGREFWRTDGTEDGTFLLKDIRSGLASSTLGVLVNPMVAGSKMFFLANNGATGNELWATDGTTDGTLLMKDINPGVQGANYGNMVAIGSNIYFTATNPPATTISLWQSNGTPEGTVVLPATVYPESIALSTLWITANNQLLARTYVNAAINSELWKATLQPGGSALVKDINTVTNGSLPNYLTVAGNLAYFRANDGVNGETLWKTDGTTAGTVMVVPPGMGTMPLDPINLTSVGNLLYFAASSTAGRELWRSDGTVAGTYMVIDLNPGGTGGGASSIFEIDGTIYFSGSNGTTGSELHKTDGTAAGTVLIKDINPGPVTSQIGHLTNLNGTLVFSAAGNTNTNNQQTNFELWKSNGTEAGTIRIKDINPGLANSSPQFLTTMNGAVYFSANNGINGIELWKTDGTEAGTIMLKDINANAANSSPQNLYVHNGFLYFSANNGANGIELWRSDGTTEGTILFKDIYPGNLNGAPASSHPANFTSLGNTLFFTAVNTSAGGTELWKSDGTNAGTIMVKDINSVAAGSNPQHLTAYGNKIYFTANGGATTNTELYVSDGTGDGTSMLGEIVPGNGTASPEQLVVLGEKLLFFATLPHIGKEIFVMNLSSAPTLVNWTGNISTAWEDANNWEPAAVPGSNTEVIIPSGRPRYPIVNANTAIKKISCASGASVQVSNNVILAVLQ